MADDLAPTLINFSFRLVSDQSGAQHVSEIVGGDVMLKPLLSAFLAGLDDLAVMGKPIEESSGHLGVAEAPSAVVLILTKNWFDSKSMTSAG